MGYYIINKKPIFIFSENIRLFNEKLFKDKDPMWIASSVFPGPKFIEREKIIINYLNELNKDNPKKFNNDWAKFDIKNDKEADMRELFSDYCYFHRNSFISDAKEYNAWDEDQKYDYLFEFIINFNINSNNWFKKIIGKKSEENIKIIIKTKHINRIVGSLERFIVYTKDFTMLCGENIVIYPKYIQKNISNYNIWIKYILF